MDFQGEEAEEEDEAEEAREEGAEEVRAARSRSKFKARRCSRSSWSLRSKVSLASRSEAVSSGRVALDTVLAAFEIHQLR